MEINQYCFINQENPTPIKERMGIAINIIPEDKNEKLQNFVLGVEKPDDCSFGTTFKNFNEKVFVESIDIDVNFSFDSIENHDEAYNNYFAVRITTKEYGVHYAWVSNIYDAYYWHSIFHTDNSLKYESYRWREL